MKLTHSQFEVLSKFSLNIAQGYFLALSYGQLTIVYDSILTRFLQALAWWLATILFLVFAILFKKEIAHE